MNKPKKPEEKNEKLPKTKVMKFDVDPYTSIAGLVVRMAPEGYDFKSYVRVNGKAKVTYIRKEA